jgi:hypothetical protein
MVRGSTFASSNSLRYVSGMPSWKLLLLRNVCIVNHSVNHFSAEPIPRYFVELNYMLNGYRTADWAHISVIGYEKNKQLFVTPGTCPRCQPLPSPSQWMYYDLCLFCHRSHHLLRPSVYKTVSACREEALQFSTVCILYLLFLSS